ncbi:MAG: hypothetical protein HY308_13520 [Gammaproteobacteria bacterium]|nr:hypothetical protein [Gammaproteobacteria bacterium]
MTLISINGIGLAIGSLVAGFAMQMLGNDGLFISISAVLAVVIICALVSLAGARTGEVTS